jgi:hypothetical protein
LPQPIPSPGSGVIGAIIVRPGNGFFAGSSPGIWNENSPLPPCTRYIELADLYVPLAATFLDYPQPQNVSFFGLDDSSLPHDSQGNVRRNAVASGVDVSGFNFVPLSDLPSSTDIAAELETAYGDDSLWTGEVADPVNWPDDYWDALLIDRAAMAAYLEAHPACRINV